MGQCVDPLEGTHASTDANGSIIAVLTPCGYASSARATWIRVLLRANLPSPAGLRPADHVPGSPRRAADAGSASAAPGGRGTPTATVDMSSAADARSRARRAAGGAGRLRRSHGVSAAEGRTAGRHRLASGRVRWTSELATTWAPSVDARLVVVAGDELLTALDAATGRTMWRVPVTGGFSAPPIAAGGWVIGTPRQRRRHGHPRHRRPGAVDAQPRLARPRASRRHRHRRLRVARRRPRGRARPDHGRAAMGTPPRRQARRICWCSTTGCSSAPTTSSSTRSRRATATSAGKGGLAGARPVRPRSMPSASTTSRSTTSCMRSTATTAA